jgi:hypothetical protein
MFKVQSSKFKVKVKKIASSRTHRNFERLLWPVERLLWPVERLLWPVSRPCHWRRPQVSTNIGDLRSGKWRGQETMPQQGAPG